MIDQAIRILCVTKSTGGLANYNRLFCENIDQSKFKVDILCLSENNEAYASDLNKLGFTTFTLDMERYAINLGADMRLMRKMLDLVREQNYDLILGHGSKAGFLVRLISRLTRVQSIYCTHSLSFLSRIHGNKARIYHVLEWLASHAFGGHIVTLSHFAKDTVVNYKIASEEDITAIHTGIPINKFNLTNRTDACVALGLDPEHPVVGWAQRFSPQKSPLDFIDAMAKVCAQYPKLQVFMAGEGELESAIKQRISDLKLDNNFTVAPWQSDVPMMLSAFDVYVLSSQWEGLPLSLLEAMALERPCVSTAVDGIVEVITHEKDGFLVDVGDTHSIAKYTMQLLDDAELRHNVGQAASQRIEKNFTTAVMIKKWEDMLQNLYRTSRS